MKQTSYTLDIGSREEQQDSINVIELNKNYLLVLADGMGGHSGGAIASKILVDTAIKYYKETKTILNPKKFFNSIMYHTQKELKKLKSDKFDAHTTAIIALIYNSTLYYSYIGDSRLYLFENKKLTFRTRDHSVPEMLYKMDEIKEEEIQNHPDQNKLLKSINADKELKPTYGEIELNEDKYYIVLLCSDGLWGNVSEKEMIKEVFSNKSLNEILSNLTNLAKEKAEDECDNISIAILKNESESIYSKVKNLFFKREILIYKDNR